MKIAVMGAGAVGGYVGGRLAEAGQEVHLIARGSHLTALCANGLRLETPLGNLHIPRIHATSNPADIGPVDVAIFAVKLPDTDTAASSLAPLLTPETRIVTLQNGIDSAEMIARHAPRSQIAEGVIYIGAHISEPGVITNPGGVHRVTVDGLNGDRKMQEFIRVCEHAKALDVAATDDPRRVVWQKFIALAAFSGATCITRLPIGPVYENPDCLSFMRSLLSENIAVANASGQNFTAAAADAVIELFKKQPYSQKSSMLIDLENGKPLELEWLSGRVHQLGAKYGIATPANTAVWAALCPHVRGSPSEMG